MKNFVIAAYIASSALQPVLAEDAVDGRPRPSHAAYLAVDYADSLQGVQAKLAVSHCAHDEEPHAGLVITETMVNTSSDIVVRMVGADGREISRTVGPMAVCQYARFAAAYIARTWPHAARGVK